MNTDEILNGAMKALIDKNHDSGLDLKPSLIFNDRDNNVLSVIETQLRQCEEFRFSTAFITDEGIKVLNGEGKQIGRFEYLYAKRDVGNRYNTFQPHLLRWVINKEEFEKTISEYEFSVKRVVDIFLSDLPA